MSSSASIPKNRREQMIKKMRLKSMLSLQHQAPLNVATLKDVFASLYATYRFTLVVHWNTPGNIGLHTLTNKMWHELAEHADAVAEASRVEGLYVSEEWFVSSYKAYSFSLPMPVKPLQGKEVLRDKIMETCQKIDALLAVRKQKNLLLTGTVNKLEEISSSLNSMVFKLLD